ncbi:MAG: hypothetical protein Q8O68_00400, partial [Candidatus Daviesbacteria bacterium]|nr:hypothetical protein [Candidatus Daviesbacteria bacterium]
MRSRKTLIWILVPVGIVIALLITGMVMRHEIMGHAITITISKKTNQQVTLYIDSVDFRILSSTVYLKNAVFSFNSLVLNKQKTLELEELRFGEIKMSGISVLRLLIFRRIKANSLVVSEPSSRMKSMNNVESQPVPPNEIIEQIQNNSSIFGKLKIQIEDVHIRAGHFRMEKMDFDKKSTLDFDYGINLHQFDTRSKLLKDTTRLFFSDEMLIRLKNIRYANPSGESLFTDSLILGSRSTLMDVYGVRFNPSTTQQTASTTISGDIQHIRLEGGDITFPSNAIDFRLQSISLSQGNLVIFKHQAEKVTDTIQLNALANAIRSISINNLNFDDCNVLMISPENDTLLRANLNNLMLKNMVADSGFQQNSEKISFDDLSWNTGELSYLEPENQIRIQVRSTCFMETTGKLNLGNTLVYNPSTDETLSYDIKISALEIDGLYIRKLLSQQDLSLSFTLNQPEIK